MLVTVVIAIACKPKTTVNESDLKEKANIAVVKYMNAMNSGKVDDLMDFIFKEAMIKEGLDNSQIRKSLNNLMESNMKPFNLKSFSPINFIETSNYYVFTIPTEASAYIEGNLVRIKSHIFSISNKSSNGESWRFIDNSSKTSEILHKHFPELHSKLLFSNPEVLSIEY